MLAEMRQELDALKKQVAKFNNLKISGFSRQESARGISFSGGEPEHGNIGRPKTVVIVKKPLATDSQLIVREAKYDSWPPAPCAGTGDDKVCHYTWYGDSFPVYPPLGKEAIDYDGDEYTAVTPPKLTTVFHRCHREHDTWVLDLQAEGGTPVIFVRLIDSVPPDDNESGFLKVQRMKLAGDSGIWQDDPDEEPEDAECWPNYVAGHYLPMKGQSPYIILPMTQVDGTQYVWQKNRFFIGDPTPTLPQSDCLVPL